MKLHYDPESDSLDIAFADRPDVATREIAEGLNADIDADGAVVGLGIDGASGKLDLTAPGDVTLPSGEVGPAAGLMEWEVPLEALADWPQAAQQPLAAFWAARIARQREIDASIAAKAGFEFPCDKPHADKSRARVAGVQQAHKEDRITFTALTGWPGANIGAEDRFMEGETLRRAGVFIGPEFGAVSRPDLAAAAREAGDAGFDVLIACAFSYDAHSAEFDKLGRVPVLKARMNPDLHMGAS